MNQETVVNVRTHRKETLAEQARRIADQLKQETDLQIKATSRILGAAAQIAENHDRLVDEVADMVEEDLDRAQAQQTSPYTGDILKQQYRTLREAKAHFGLKANSWADLVGKLNLTIQKQIPAEQSEASVLKRLDAIESELKVMRTEVSQILVLLKQRSG